MGVDCGVGGCRGGADRRHCVEHGLLVGLDPDEQDVAGVPRRSKSFLTVQRISGEDDAMGRLRMLAQ